jgi:2'-5' RNA ligase
MRLFTALDLSDALRRRLADLRAPGDLDARWTAPEQYHITLRFIGEVDADTATQYENALRGLQAPAAHCVPCGLDVLPSRQSPRVLVVGLERTASLGSVYEAVSDALGTAGLPPEDRAYRPHVTLARLNDCPADTVHRFLRTRSAEDLPSHRAPRVHLYESTLTHEGAIHERRSTYPLGKA